MQVCTLTRPNSESTIHASTVALYPHAAIATILTSIPALRLRHSARPIRPQGVILVCHTCTCILAPRPHACHQKQLARSAKYPKSSGIVFEARLRSMLSAPSHMRHFFIWYSQFGTWYHHPRLARFAEANRTVLLTCIRRMVILPADGANSRCLESRDLLCYSHE